jgi:membrane protease YdiL (CAAX protease family)
MVAERPWKSEAVLRLVLSVFACYLLGSVLSNVVQVLLGGGPYKPVFFGLAVGAGGLLGSTLWVLQRDFTGENLSRRILLLLVSFYGGIFLAWWAQRVAGPAQMTTWHAVASALSLQGCALVLVGLLLLEHGLTWVEAFGLRRSVPKVVVAGLAATLAYIPVGWSLQLLSAEAMTRIPGLGLEPEVQQSVQVLRDASSWGDQAAMGFVTVLLAPVAEEVVFRGILYTWVRQLGFPRLAFGGTAVLFAMVHFNLMSFLPVLGLALLLTFLYARTQNLLAPIVAHSLFNALNFVALFFQLHAG